LNEVRVKPRSSELVEMMPYGKSMKKED